MKLLPFKLDWRRSSALDHWTSNSGVAGSNPRGGTIFSFCFFLNLPMIFIFYLFYYLQLSSFFADNLSLFPPNIIGFYFFILNGIYKQTSAPQQLPGRCRHMQNFCVKFRFREFTFLFLGLSWILSKFLQ